MTSPLTHPRSAVLTLKEITMRKILAILALAGLPALALAIDVSTLASGDPSGVLAAILDAIQHGQVGLAVVVALVLAVRLVRQFAGGAVTSAVKATLKTDDATAQDVGGTLLAFALTALVMVAGPVSAGAAISGALVKTAVLTALAASGGWAFLKKLAAPLFSKIPLVGGVVEWLVGRFVDKQLPPAPATVAARAPVAPAALQAASAPAADTVRDSLGDTDPHTGP